MTGVAAGPPSGEGILFTDQYQLTMAQLYFEQGMHEVPAVFDFFFRSYPDYGGHRAGFCVFAGLDPLIDWIGSTTATTEDVDYLRSQETATGAPRFKDGFLEWLGSEASFGSLTVESVAEGRVVHPHEPIVTVTGPLAVAQVLETALLNFLNYPTLIATKAARVSLAGEGRPVLEFGMRRGPRFGANDGARAAVIGGAAFTSNVAASARLGLDPKGTHAHSMVQAFIAAGGTELDAFHAYAQAYPDDCLLLVDTIHTVESGLPNAITVFEELRSRGHEPVGIRLDSGDAAELAVAAARMLDDAGFTSAQIVVSSDLDEMEISRLLERLRSLSAREGVDVDRIISRIVFGVGTRLITSHGDPALSGVYKLAAVERDGAWAPASKTTDSPTKASLPGVKDFWRIYDASGMAELDLITLEGETVAAGSAVTVHEIHEGSDPEVVVPAEAERLRRIVFGGGGRVDEVAELGVIRSRTHADVGALPSWALNLDLPAGYRVGISERLAALRDAGQ